MNIVLRAVKITVNVHCLPFTVYDLFCKMFVKLYSIIWK